MPEKASSLSKRVPLFIGLLLFVVLGVAFTIEYVQLRRLLVQVNNERLESATVLVAELLSEQMRSGAEERALQADTLVRELLATGMAAGPAADSLLRARLPGEGSLRTIAVIDEAGSCVAGASDDRVGELAVDPCSTAGDEAVGDVSGPGGQEQVSPFYQIGDEAWFRVTVPADADGWQGHVVYASALSSGTSGTTISGLIAPDATLLLGNADGSTWTDLATVVDGPQAAMPDRVPLRFEGEGGSRIGIPYRIAGTPWIALAHRDMGSVLAPSRQFLVWTGGAGALVLLASTVFGWLVSLRVTRPLAAVTHGAEAVAGGDYTRRVDVERNDELGRLATAFNAMAERVDDRHQTLEARVQERTQTLQEALDQLAKTQDQLVRKERLATLGQLSGGVGHELRNPLGVMTNALFYLEATHADAPPKVREYLGILKSQIGIAEKIVSDLLDFARVNTPDRAHVDVATLVRNSLERYPLDGSISAQVDVPESVPPLYVDSRQMEQVLVNLISNAVHAMQDSGGTLSFSATHDGDQVILRVADTGSGMTQDQLDTVFEPLVTTKAKGIGLGLAVSKMLASANGVELGAESELGKGSVFILRFPAAALEAAS